MLPARDLREKRALACTRRGGPAFRVRPQEPRPRGEHVVPGAVKPALLVPLLLDLALTSVPCARRWWKSRNCAATTLPRMRTWSVYVETQVDGDVCEDALAELGQELELFDAAVGGGSGRYSTQLAVLPTTCSKRFVTA